MTEVGTTCDKLWFVIYKIQQKKLCSKHFYLLRLSVKFYIQILFLTQWSKYLLQELTLVQLARNLSSLWNPQFITVFTTHIRSLSILNQISPHPTSYFWRTHFNVTITSNPRSLNWHLLSGFPSKISQTTRHLSYLPSNPPQFQRPNNIG